MIHPGKRESVELGWALTGMRSVRMESKVKVGDKELVRRNVSGLSQKVPYLSLLRSNTRDHRLICHQSILPRCSIAKARILGWVCVYVRMGNKPVIHSPQISLDLSPFSPLLLGLP